MPLPLRSPHLFGALLAATGFAWPSGAHAELSVVATTPDLAAIAQAVGGDLVEVEALAVETQDPHYVDARPNLVLPLSRADLLVVNGLELEVGWLPALLSNARNGGIQPGGDGYFDASSVVAKLDVRTADRAMGDIHPGGNPHFTHDPRAAATIAIALGESMARLDPEHAADYEAAAATFAKKLRYIAERERRRFAAIPAERRRVVAYHGSLVYLMDWLGLEQIQTVEPKPGIPPDPAHVARVLEAMKGQGARLILQEPYYPAKTSETLARLSGGELVVIPGGCEFRRGEGYLKRVMRTAKVIHDALAR